MDKIFEFCNLCGKKLSQEDIDNKYDLCDECAKEEASHYYETFEQAFHW